MQQNTTEIQCNNCSQKLRIPYDRGNLKVTCPNCKTSGIWRENSKSHSSDLLKKIITSKINNIRNYTPKVGVFGVTGVGKSSLCNALFGQDVAPVSDVAACTREPKEIFIGNGGVGIKLIDVPGVGETIERDKEYFELYRKLAPELDLILWVIKADDRAYASAEKAYREILCPNLKNCPVLFVINQVDKLNPLKDWDLENNKPGVDKQKNIDKKVEEVSKAFNVSKDYIETVSVEEKYNLVKLMDAIVEILPNEKKYSFVREAKEDVKNDDIKQKAEKGIWDSVKKIAGETWDSVKDVAVEILTATALGVMKKFWEKGKKGKLF
ncbi:50S ribosome-binding GTPase [Acinetobacter sp. R933-2]|uniref:GTPase family protein n=1 Tax=Acinetobacter sp. R933-2 TaxID=2746728 RepID=UPI002577949B|nr:GTPase [Acinetobacter sp. R933-2]MDM1249434.1 50S ribosome-binding GTPase [Acinetobacter sp. R933-2]